ncbi:MAG: SEC-C domain-containing protein [Pseudomonadota bacterium]
MAIQRGINTGRNQPCPCGSGKRFKQCHGTLSDHAPAEAPDTGMPTDLKREMALEVQRKQQQVSGNPIISGTFKDHQFIAVGNVVHWGKWNTVIDFLSDYIKKVLGAEWGNAEIAKPLADRHPVMQWYDAICRHQLEVQEVEKPTRDGPTTGAIAAYFELAYNLYLLDHNAELQKRLIIRLKNPGQFRDACYEALSGAAFVLAGFTLELENEQEDATHCDFTAIHKISGNKYSVEAKTRAPNAPTADVGEQLSEALAKKANFQRLVMIDTNLPTGPNHQLEAWRHEVIEGLRGREATLTVHDAPAPSAYVLVTNSPYSYALDPIHPARWALVDGFKIPDFGFEAKSASLLEAFKTLRKHRDVLSVFEAIRGYQLPVTFDGEWREFARSVDSPRFVIGEKFDLSEVAPGMTAELEQAVVATDGRTVHLVMKMASEHRNVYTNTFTDAEAAAYKLNPATFFGTESTARGAISTPMDMFEFFYMGYRNTPRSRVMEFLSGAPDIEALSLLSDDDLRLTYCERSVWGSGVFNEDGSKR